MIPDLSDLGWQQTTEESHVELGSTGDGKAAIIERATKEPIQYVTSSESAPGLLARWRAVFEAKVTAARGQR
jgi:hypothetical protein